MIIRVWGIVNDAEVEFTPIRDKPGYWEGIAPRAPDMQEVEIWAENDKGARGHLQCSVQIVRTPTYTKLVLLPYIVELTERYKITQINRKVEACLRGCRKVAG